MRNKHLVKRLSIVGAKVIVKDKVKIKEFCALLRRMPLQRPFDGTKGGVVSGSTIAIIGDYGGPEYALKSV